MNDKTDTSDKKPEDDDGGFEIYLPLGMGKIWGKGRHLELLMPIIKWLVVATTLLFAVAQAFQTLGIKLQ